MLKRISKIVCFLIIFTIIAISMPQKQVEAVSYKLTYANTDGTYKSTTSTYSSFADAYNAFNNVTDKSAVILGSNNKVYAMKEGMANIYTSNGANILVFNSTFPGGTETYATNNSVAYYVRTNSNLTVDIMISGYKGTTSVNNLVLIPSNHVYPKKTGNRIYQYEFDFYTSNNYGEMIHYMSHYSNSNANTKFYTIKVDKAPAFMKKDIRYYCVDGFHYYTDPYAAVVNDMSHPSYAGKHAIYYKYLSFRTQTSYSANELNSFIAYKSKTFSYEGRDTVFLGLGSSFLQAQNSYGVNGAMEIAFANLESAYGKSGYATSRYNLFGIGAVDSNPDQAFDFASPTDCVLQHSKYYMNWYFCDAYAYINKSLGSGYYDVSSKPSGYINSYSGDSRYFGAFPGSKAAGINVKYASDPWHGEKIANRMYEIDSYLGLKDYGKYSIAITKTATYAYAEPSTDAWKVYKYSSRDPNRNGGSYSTVPVGMAMAVIGEEGDFYKVQAEMPMNSDKYSIYTWDYDFEHSVAYVPKSDVDLVFVGANIDGEEVTPPPPPPVAPPDPDELTGSYVILEDGNFLTRIEENTDISTFNLTMQNANFELYDIDGQTPLTSGMIKTGMSVKILDTDDTELGTYTILVRGDLNKDGKVTTTDVVLFSRYKAGLDKTIAPYEFAMDVNYDGKTTTTDAVIISREKAGLQ